MLLPKSKSWVTARYVVFTESGKEPILCRYNYKTKSFAVRETVSSFGEGSWQEWVDIDNVISWVRVDTLRRC